MGDDIVTIKAFLKIEQGSAPVCGSRLEFFKLRFYERESFLGEISHFLSSVSTPSWNSKCIVGQGGEFLDWLRTKGVIPPYSRFPPEWEAIVDKIHPGLDTEQILSMAAEAKIRIEAEKGSSPSNPGPG